MSINIIEIANSVLADLDTTAAQAQSRREGVLLLVQAITDAVSASASSEEASDDAAG